MSNFLNGLWASVFQPGPSPPLLLATNISFLCLQLIFAGLLILTRSVHFIALSVVCAGLWWGINWFVVELAEAERVEKEKREKKEGAGGKARDDTIVVGGEGRAGGEGEGMDSGDDTEVEASAILNREDWSTSSSWRERDDNLRKRLATSSISQNTGPSSSATIPTATSSSTTLTSTAPPVTSSPSNTTPQRTAQTTSTPTSMPPPPPPPQFPAQNAPPGIPQSSPLAPQLTGPTPSSAAGSKASSVRMRDSISDLSATDSEWEKVSSTMGEEVADAGAEGDAGAERS